ncbi:MAG: class I SAM-dependent methyltransferase [Pseudomonadota bacterium]
MSDVSNEWSNYWTDNASASGEVFVNAKGETHPEVASWWRDCFAGLGGTGSIIDLACGAGSIFQHLPTEHSYKLHGADISDEALTQLRTRFRTIETTQCPADKLPFADHEFDVVVSQFGIEYAGMPAFHEAARIVTHGGSLLVLSHLRNSYIDARNRAHLDAAHTILSSRFVPNADALITMVFKGHEADARAAAGAFRESEQSLGNAVKRLPEGIHAHLYMGFKQLWERRSDYRLDDIRTWLGNMEADVHRNILRFENMCQAARSEDEIRNFVQSLEKTGWESAVSSEFQISNHDKPLAWAIKAKKQRV